LRNWDYWLRLQGTELRLSLFFIVRNFAKARVVSRAIVKSGVCFVLETKGLLMLLGQQTTLGGPRRSFRKEYGETTNGV